MAMPRATDYAELLFHVRWEAEKETTAGITPP
jgi:hypothetical protein